jgi:CheY-like chemotaxis protein
MASNKKKIFTIDDDQEIQNLLKVYLKKSYDLEQATNGAEAFDMLEKMTDLPDLILLDVEMPKMDGPTFRQKIKEHPLLNMIPILYLTSNTQFRDKLDHDFDFDFLNKPIEKEDLLSILDSFFAIQN